MTQHTPEYGRTVAKAAEHQMRQWVLRLENQERVSHEQAVARLPERVHPYLAISRETGARATEIARRVGARLGWEVLDKELLTYMAERYHLSRGELDFLDETTSSWLVEIFGKWLDRRLVTQSEFVTHLGQVVLMAAHHGSAVFVGRGAQFFLPRERGVAVQIVAAPEQRLESVMGTGDFSRDEGLRYIEHTDEARRDFIERYFHHDVDDAHLYDLVLNLGYVALDDAVDLIVAQCERRFGPLQGRSAITSSSSPPR